MTIQALFVRLVAVALIAAGCVLAAEGPPLVTFKPASHQTAP